jgi:hypothetical protein
MEQLEQVARHAGVAIERICEITQPERRAELAQVGGIGPQDGRLAPVGAARHHQPVEAVVVGQALEDGQKRLL